MDRIWQVTARVAPRNRDGSVSYAREMRVCLANYPYTWKKSAVLTKYTVTYGRKLQEYTGQGYVLLGIDIQRLDIETEEHDDINPAHQLSLLDMLVSGGVEWDEDIPF